MKDKDSKTARIVKTINIILFCSIFLISLFACIPNSKTAAGQNLFQFFGNYINKHSPAFFFVILILCTLEIILLAAQFYTKQSVIKEHIDDMEKDLDTTLRRITFEDGGIRNRIHDLEIEVLEAKHSSLQQIGENNSKLKLTLIKTETAYKDNLRSYYDCNRQIYIIVKNTQLDQIKSIDELIDTYCKL